MENFESTMKELKDFFNEGWNTPQGWADRYTREGRGKGRQEVTAQNIYQYARRGSLPGYMGCKKVACFDFQGVKLVFIFEESVELGKRGRPRKV